MGGCVVSVMDYRNTASVVDCPKIQAFKKYGAEGVPMTSSKAGATETRSAVYRSADIDDAKHEKLKVDNYKADNLAQRFEKLCNRRPEQRAFAYRPLEKVVKESVRQANGSEKVMDITYLHPTQYMTFAQIRDHIVCFGRGLVGLGLTTGDTVAIYEETRWEWLVTMYGIWSQGFVASTVYSNLGVDALVYALRETENKAIVCNGKQVGTLLKMIQNKEIPKCVIVYFGPLPTGVDYREVTVVSWNDVVAKGRASSAPINIPTDNDTLALIMYTSGTTGDPKGVMHTHGSLSAGVRAMEHRLGDLMGPYEDGEAYCSYLPLAHILEFGVVNIFLSRGALIGFGSPRTLTDATARPTGDFVEYKPAAIIGVPRIFDTLKKAVESKLPPPGSLKRNVFDHAYQSRLAALKEGKDTPFWNEKVFGTARATLGGSLRLMLSGGGPLSAATQEYINVVFGLIIQGWGLTETVCVGGIQRIGDIEEHVVGQPPLTEEVRLLNTDEYKHTDKPEPRGEILVRGPYLFKGYYKQPELTKEAIDEDGWFHTGDVGSITPQGSLRIIGRVKGLAKNVLGEYIAMEALEAMYTHCDLCIPNGVCVLVHPEKAYVTALVLTDAHRATKFASEKGIAGDYESLFKNPEFHKKAAEALAETGRAAGRKPFELVKYVRVLNDEWTPENDVLTAAMKLKRRVIDVKYADVIAELFVPE